MKATSLIDDTLFAVPSTPLQITRMEFANLAKDLINMMLPEIQKRYANDKLRLKCLEQVVEDAIKRAQTDHTATSYKPSELRLELIKKIQKVHVNHSAGASVTKWIDYSFKRKNCPLLLGSYAGNESADENWNDDNEINKELRKIKSAATRLRNARTKYTYVTPPGLARASRSTTAKAWANANVNVSASRSLEKASSTLNGMKTSPIESAETPLVAAEAAAVTSHPVGPVRKSPVRKIVIKKPSAVTKTSCAASDATAGVTTRRAFARACCTATSRLSTRAASEEFSTTLPALTTPISQHLTQSTANGSGSSKRKRSDADVPAPRAITPKRTKSLEFEVPSPDTLATMPLNDIFMAGVECGVLFRGHLCRELDLAAQ